jgi:predicted AAA+ superfamily ATPase
MPHELAPFGDRIPAALDDLADYGDYKNTRDRIAPARVRCFIISVCDRPWKISDLKLC